MEFPISHPHQQTTYYHCGYSVGGQATVGYRLDFEKITLGCGYKSYLMADSKESLTQSMKTFVDHPGPVFLEVKTKPGAREDLGRPTIKPVENKKDFIQNLSR